MRVIDTCGLIINGLQNLKVQIAIRLFNLRTDSAMQIPHPVTGFQCDSVSHPQNIINHQF